ncbi:PREDICTED: cell division cycle protein 123 homolog [Branchiostoma belcheri]|uniref:Translation initiation factor eIF2 assembly protein n=1 Tax=Branchiostoma belcheri TaxID=7741 RepID=A0A6P5A1I6_BRABE|nr:PREDICTED: cell division cycle protein 123 homolog [Branchiostoma belcheri]
MKKRQVMNCIFSAWYPRFEHLTFPSVVLPLPEQFVSYLLADGIVLPNSVRGKSHKSSYKAHPDDDSDVEDPDWSDDDDDNAPTDAPEFPELEAQIKQAITHLGGKVFPKLNWSAPKDASWIAMNNSLQCTSPEDIYLLLKSSDFVTHDLTQPFDRCEDEDTDVDVPYELVLRRWTNVHPGMEFRCFVKNDRLIAISQRHHSNFFPYIHDQHDSIQADIVDFYHTDIEKKFPDPSFVFDVYRKKAGKLLLVDLNPFCEVTDPLLFTWDELTSGETQGGSNSTEGEGGEEGVVFRYIKNEMGVQPNPLHSYRVPEDIAHLTSGEDAYKLIDFLQMKCQSQEGEESSGMET